MVFYFLISIVFIAEVIIALALVLNLVKLDKIFVEYNEVLNSVKPSIKELLITVRKISEQMIEISPMIVKQIKSTIVDIIMGQLKSFIGTLTFILVKKEVEKHASKN